MRRRARAADKGFERASAAAPGRRRSAGRFGALMQAALANPRLRPQALAQIEQLQLETAKQIAAGYVAEGAPATFRVIVNPLVTWMWIGGLIALAGALIGLWPTRSSRRGLVADSELEALKEAKYREIRDAELDHAAGKLSDEDFALLDAELRNEAVEILDSANGANGQRQPQGSTRSRLLDLQQYDGVEDEQDREEDRRPVEVALDHRAAAEGAAAAADAEGAGEAGVFAGVQQDQEDQHAGDDHLDEAQERVHDGEW